MDTSEQFIKMCETSGLQPELQPWHVMESNRDLFYDFGDVWYAYTIGEGKEQTLVKVKVFTQDQLQEMVGKQAYDLVRQFYLWCFDNCLDVCNYSMEQLWLSFVMKEKYSKQWLTDSQEWVSI